MSVLHVNENMLGCLQCLLNRDMIRQSITGIVKAQGYGFSMRVKDVLLQKLLINRQ